MNAPFLPRELRAVTGTNFPSTPEHLAQLREKIPNIPDLDDFGRAVSKNGTEKIVMNGDLDNFDAVWQFGRLLHNLGRTEDAISYFGIAHELEPEHCKALGRLAEAALELHEELPSQRYDVLAHAAANKLITLEDSDYARELYETSAAHVGLREIREGVEYSRDI